MESRVNRRKDHYNDLTIQERTAIKGYILDLYSCVATAIFGRNRARVRCMQRMEGDDAVEAQTGRSDVQYVPLLSDRCCVWSETH